MTWLRTMVRLDFVWCSSLRFWKPYSESRRPPSSPSSKTWPKTSSSMGAKNSSSPIPSVQNSPLSSSAAAAAIADSSFLSSSSHFTTPLLPPPPPATLPT
ncbi:hypothetical protein GUJ93_ZPchr0007g6334 [Zizania palustris]|uniref:Uncharacterized protein n=1 Tax=Zizania palustris TaxID=103762 RepID=A0A8J5SIW1_ZIZPA|nr:hypothetical protein GUJ93_ZPchr0007g6334 [Zizania palustris]